MRINLKECLYFFDDRTAGNPFQSHATAVVGFLGEDLNAAAFKHYWESMKEDTEILLDKVTTKQRKGPRLDRWILVGKGQSQILYQTEIKSWSAWATSSYSFKPNDDIKKVANFAKSDWERELNEFYINKPKSDTKARKVNKVLWPMSAPDRLKNFTIEPLVIHWRPINAKGQEIPLWDFPVNKLGLKFNSPFKKINYFSVSLYFRQLLKKGESAISLDLPQVKKRLYLLEKLNLL